MSDLIDHSGRWRIRRRSHRACHRACRLRTSNGGCPACGRQGRRSVPPVGKRCSRCHQSTETLRNRGWAARSPIGHGCLGTVTRSEWHVILPGCLATVRLEALGVPDRIPNGQGSDPIGLIADRLLYKSPFFREEPPTTNWSQSGRGYSRTIDHIPCPCGPTCTCPFDDGSTITLSVIPGGNGGRTFPSTLMAWCLWIHAARSATNSAAMGLSWTIVKSPITVVALGASNPSRSAFALLARRNALTSSLCAVAPRRRERTVATPRSAVRDPRTARAGDARYRA